MRADEHSWWRFLPLLAGELVVASAALAGLTLSTDEPRYEGFVHGAVVVGLAVSALALARRRQWPLFGAVVMLVAGGFYLGRNFLSVGLPLFFPPEILANEDLLLAALVGWVLVAFSFWQAQRTNLVFLIVCGLAIFGLVGTVNLNSEILVAFAVFIFGAVFCWGYEQFLDLQDRVTAAGRPATADWLDMARGQLSVAVLVGLLTFGLGSVVGTGAYQATPNLYARMTERAYGWTLKSHVPSIFNSFTSSFRIGPGPVRLSEAEVMRVQADFPGLWRGLTYDYYDGHAWTRTARDGSPLEENGVDFTVPRRLVPPMNSWRVNAQRLTTAGPNAVIFATTQPVAFRPGAVPVQGGPGQRLAVPSVDPYGCLSWAFGGGGGRREYWVMSHEPVSDPATLRAAPADYSASNFEPFRQVPALTRATLMSLVTRLTAGASTPYDKVAALQQYVETTCLYTLDAPAVPRGAGQDAVDWFLNHSQRGACDLFSSSLAVLARLAGVPARVATGYATGEYDSAGGCYVVKANDAHAWVEIYFNGIGWVSFDPQARRSYDDQSLAELFTSGHWRLGLREATHSLLVFVFLALVVVAALAAFIDPFQLLRRLLTRPSPSPLARLSAEYQAFYTLLLRRSGVSPSAAMTPQEAVTAIVAALPRHLRLDRRRLQAVNERFYHLRYSDDASFDELAKLRQELQSLRKLLKRR